MKQSRGPMVIWNQSKRKLHGGPQVGPNHKSTLVTYCKESPITVLKGSVFTTVLRMIHYENMPIQIYWKFYHQKIKIFR